MTRICLVLGLLAAPLPALAQNYPLQGKWGQDSSSEQGPVDCSKLKTVDFSGGQRRNSSGGVRDMRTVTVTRSGEGYRVTEEFNTGQVNARNTIGLRQVDADRAELSQRGGTVKLRRCK